MSHATAAWCDTIGWAKKPLLDHTVSDTLCIANEWKLQRICGAPFETSQTPVKQIEETLSPLVQSHVYVASAPLDRLAWSLWLPNLGRSLQLHSYNCIAHAHRHTTSWLTS